MCSQLKLQYQVKRDLKASKKDLGSFCSQYGIEMPIPPSQRHTKQKHYKEKPYKNTKNLRVINQLIKNKNLIQNIKEKLDVLNVIKKVI